MDAVVLITEDELSQILPINKRTLCRYRQEGMPHFTARKANGALYFTYAIEYILPWMEQSGKKSQYERLIDLYKKEAKAVS